MLSLRYAPLVTVTTRAPGVATRVANRCPREHEVPVMTGFHVHLMTRWRSRKGFQVHHARIVEHDVQPVGARSHLRSEPFDARRVGEVERDGGETCRRHHRSDARYRLDALVQAAAGNEDPRPFRASSRADRKPSPRLPSGTTAESRRSEIERANPRPKTLPRKWKLRVEHQEETPGRGCQGNVVPDGGAVARALRVFFEWDDR